LPLASAADAAADLVDAGLEVLRLEEDVSLMLQLSLSSEVLSSSSESLSSPRRFEFAPRRFELDARRRRTPPCDDADRAADAALAEANCLCRREPAACVFSAVLKRRGDARRFEGFDESILLRKQVREMQK
jgi:hypothetical protein